MHDEHLELTLAEREVLALLAAGASEVIGNQ